MLDHERTPTRLRDDVEHLLVVQVRLEQRVELFDRLVVDVVVRRHAPEVRHREAAGLGVEARHAAAVELLRGVGDELAALAVEHRVALAHHRVDAVHHRVADHAHEEVRIRQPLHSLDETCGVDESKGCSIAVVLRTGSLRLLEYPTEEERR